MAGWSRINVMQVAQGAVFIGAIVAPGCGGKTPTTPSATQTTPASPTAQTPTTPPVAAPRLPAGVTTEMVAEGTTLFRGGTCPICHGSTGRGGAGPDLTDSVFLHNSGGFEEIVAVITTGVPADKFRSSNSIASLFMLPRGAMNITDAQVRSLAAYVWTLSHPNG